MCVWNVLNDCIFYRNNTVTGTEVVRKELATSPLSINATAEGRVSCTRQREKGGEGKGEMVDACNDWEKGKDVSQCREPPSLFGS